GRRAAGRSGRVRAADEPPAGVTARGAATWRAPPPSLPPPPRGEEPHEGRGAPAVRHQIRSAPLRLRGIAPFTGGGPGWGPADRGRSNCGAAPPSAARPAAAAPSAPAAPGR